MTEIEIQNLTRGLLLMAASITGTFVGVRYRLPFGFFAILYGIAGRVSVGQLAASIGLGSVAQLSTNFYIQSTFYLLIVLSFILKIAQIEPMNLIYTRIKRDKNRKIGT